MPFWVEIKTHKDRTIKFCVLLSCWLALGMSLGIVGPTLLDLQELVEVDESRIAFALSSRSGGYAIGSFLSEYPIHTIILANHVLHFK